MADASVVAESAFANPPFDTDALLIDALRRWKAAVIAYRDDPGCGDDPEWEKLLQAADKITAEIDRIPATGVEGLAIKTYLAFERECGMAIGNDWLNLEWHSERQKAAVLPVLQDAMRLAPAAAAILGY